MTNLLTNDSKKELWRSYRARFISALSIVLMVVAAVGFASLVPTYLAINSLAPAPDKAATTEKADTSVLNRANTITLQTYNVVMATSSVRDVMARALKEKPAAVSIDRMVYMKRETSELQISGLATRSATNEFRQKLAQIPIFTTVNVPVGSLVGADDKFSLTLGGTF